MTQNVNPKNGEWAVVGIPKNPKIIYNYNIQINHWKMVNYLSDNIYIFTPTVSCVYMAYLFLENVEIC